MAESRSDPSPQAVTRRDFAALTALSLVLPGCAVDGASRSNGAESEAVAAPPAALRAEGVPSIPQSLLAAAQRYNRVAGHVFVDWHPERREMLLRHRAPGASTTQLYRLSQPMAEPERLTDAADPVGSARYSPSRGSSIVLSRGSGGDEAYQLLRLDPLTRATTQITAPGQRHSLLGWLKSKPLALIASVPLDRTAAAGSRSQVSTTLSLVDPDEPASTRVLAELPGGGWFDAEVSPDDASVALVRYVSAAESEVWLIQLSDSAVGSSHSKGQRAGQRRRLLPAPDSNLRATHFVAHWAADGQSLYVISDRVGEFRELMRLDLRTGTLQRLTADTPWDVEQSSESPDGRVLAINVNVDGRDEMRLIDAASGARLPLPAGVTLPEGSVTSASFHDRFNLLALVVNSARGPSQVHSLDLDSGRLDTWTTPAGTEGLNLQNLPPQQIVRWRSFDGRDISGVLSLPPARFMGRRPVVLVMHGGPEAQSKLGWQGRLNYLTQELGVAVLEPNVRGSSGYGKTFLSLDNGRLREDSVKDMASAIDWVATQPGLDAARVMVQGGSYGGYMALAAATRLADRIAGAIAVVGISNFVSFLENTESYRRDLRRVEYGDERDPAMRALLTQISPLSHVARITQPLLVVQGKNDPRVPWTESEQIVRSLQARGTPVWYILADNEGHGFARRENADYYFATLVLFVQRTLKL